MAVSSMFRSVLPRKVARGLLMDYGIDKDFPLTGVVICFTSVQIERRVSAYQRVSSKKT